MNLFLDALQDTSGVPDHDSGWRDVPGDNATGANDGILTDDHSGKNRCPGAYRGPLFHEGVFDHPIGLCLQLSVHCGCAGVGVIDKSDIVPDKNIVLYSDTFADEGVTGDFAVFTDNGVLLDFNKSADFAIVTNRTTIEVNELRKLYVFAQRNVA